MSNGAANGATTGAAQMNEIMQAGLNKAADLLDKENFEEAAAAADDSDVERANDGVYAAAHARAVQRACTEAIAPVCECGLFAGSAPSDASQVVVSHAPFGGEIRSRRSRS